MSVNIFAQNSKNNELEQREFRDSIQAISRQIDTNPLDVSLRLQKASLNIQANQLQYALDEYTTVLQIQPHNLEALYYRGFVNQALKRYTFAKNDYEEVLKYDSANRYARMGIILTCLEEGRQIEAYDGANILVSMYPDVALSYDVRAEVEERMKLLDAAIDDIKKAIDIERSLYTGSIHLTSADDLTSYYLRLYQLYKEKSDKKNAKQCLDTLVKYGIAKALLIDYYNAIKR